MLKWVFLSELQQLIQPSIDIPSGQPGVYNSSPKLSSWVILGCMEMTMKSVCHSKTPWSVQVRDSGPEFTKQGP